ncbi:hypothetical protein BJY01DRAFT_252846 [Aspergillus pseudoustus]|uniref:DUF1203 domain-containing protein n=1 Tax=Aspergillus pseudoustus TaxID=1810923 RepID=A0ABR4J428_9EURO
MKFTPLPAPLEIDLSKSVLKPVTEEWSGPCRRCLTDARTGESLLLLSYNPFLGSSPYTSPGPIFVHYPECDRAYICDGSVPEQQARRPISVRAYDSDHMMVEGVVVVSGGGGRAGFELQKKLEELFEDSKVDYVHLHYAGAGCFAVRVDR